MVAYMHVCGFVIKVILMLPFIQVSKIFTKHKKHIKTLGCVTE